MQLNLNIKHVYCVKLQFLFIVREVDDLSEQLDQERAIADGVSTFARLVESFIFVWLLMFFFILKMSSIYNSLKYVILNFYQTSGCVVLDTRSPTLNINKFVFKLVTNTLC